MKNRETDIRATGSGDAAGHPGKLLLTIDELAEMTGLSIGTLYHWVSQRRIPVVRFSSRCVRFSRTAIEAWIATHNGQSSSKG
jgi:excisionase family DNA binding protein